VKKVLVLDGSPHPEISGDHAASLNELKHFLNGQDDYELRTADIQHTALEVVHGTPKVLIDLQDDIRDFDLVIFRNASRFPGLAAPVCLYLSHHGLDFANGMEGTGMYVGKIAQMFLYALNGLPVPDSLVVRNPTAAAKYLPGFTKGKVIIKDNNGIKGRRNYLLENGQDIASFLEGRLENYIIQPFIENDGDYRVLFMGYYNPPLIFRRTGAADSHLNNTSQGGRADLVGDFPTEALETARKAAVLSGREIAGVDILFDRQGKHYVLEVNETPAIVSGFMPEAKLKLLNTYIRKKTGIE
jgi:glutathione synthase/RimK-type ligase-like ATP-grasp enzyme